MPIFSKPYNNDNQPLKSTETNKINYGSLLEAPKTPTKEIKIFSLCPPQHILFQKKIDSLSNKQVEKNEVRINAGLSK